MSMMFIHASRDTCYALTGACQKMRILMILRRFEPTEASLYSPMYFFCQKLAEMGHEIHILTPSEEKQDTKRMVKNFYIHYVKKPKARILTTPLFFTHIIQIVLENKIDVLYSHISGIYGLMVGSVGLFLRKPTFHWHCGFEAHFARGKSLFQRLRSYYLLAIAFKLVRTVITCTNATKQHYIKFFKIPPNKIEIMPNSVDTDLFNPEKNSKETLIKHNLVGKRVILFVHRLSSSRGPEYLIKALPHMMKDGYEDFHCIMIGSGSQLGELKELAKRIGVSDKVTFTGALPNIEIPKYMAASDVFVCPSISEGFGRVIIEAMACKKPIIATRTGGIPEVAPDGEVAILVPPKDPVAIAKAIERILGDQSFAERLSTEAYNRAQRLYSTENVAKRFIEIISKRNN